MGVEVMGVEVLLVRIVSIILDRCLREIQIMEGIQSFTPIINSDAVGCSYQLFFCSVSDITVQ